MVVLVVVETRLRDVWLVDSSTVLVSLGGMAKQRRRYQNARFIKERLRDTYEHRLSRRVSGMYEHSRRKK